MTHSYQTPPESVRSTPGWTYPVLGLLQGIVLWLIDTPDEGLPGWWVHGGGRAGAWHFALMLPLAWYLGDDAATARRRRLAVAIGLGLLFGLLGAHLGTTADPPQRLATCVLGFTLIALSVALPTGRRAPLYPRLFAHTWRNALALPLAAALTGVLWMLLWAAAALMASIDLQVVFTLIGQPAFRYPVTCGAFGLALGAVLRRADLLLAVRRFWLGLNTWFLPLVLAFALVWLASLCFTGLLALFATRQAALMLFWFCLLAVVFVNAAFQDGREPPALPRPLAAACRWAWLAIPLLALLGDWALWQRVRQYGWSDDRIWAAVVGLMLTLHALGYAASLPWRRRWMAALPATNVAVALVLVAVLLTLVSPLADSRRLAVESQVARLLEGRVAVDEFDWNYLRSQAPYGPRALERLAASSHAERESARLIGQRAAREHQALDPQARAQHQREQRLAMLQQIEVLPASQGIDPALLESLAGPDSPGLEPVCTLQAARCLFWLADLDGDGQPEAVLLSEDEGEPFASSHLFAQTGAAWQWQGAIRGKGLPLARWREAIDRQAIHPTLPLWPDLLMDGERLQIRN